MRFIFTVLITALLAPHALAKTMPLATIDGVCRFTSTHVPQGDVEHVGDSAVPADLNPLNGNVGTVHIPLTLDLAARFGIDVPLGAELEPDVAVIAVQQDGSVLYNGQYLSQNIVTVCGQMHADDGQAPPDALGSTPTQQ